MIDYKSGGELFSHLQKDGGRFEEGKVRFYLCEIILALQYLHDAGIIYRYVPHSSTSRVCAVLTLAQTARRDLKPENCLLDGSGHVVLVDFGLSKLLKSSNDCTRTMCGTTAFMAPGVSHSVGLLRLLLMPSRRGTTRHRIQLQVRLVEPRSPHLRDVLRVRLLSISPVRG